MNTQNRVSLHRVSNVCEAALISLFLAPEGLNKLTEMDFKISFHSDWQINNSFFNRPIMERNQILVHRWGPRTRIWYCFADELNQGFGFICDAG